MGGGGMGGGGMGGGGMGGGGMGGGGMGGGGMGGGEREAVKGKEEFRLFWITRIFCNLSNIVKPSSSY